MAIDWGFLDGAVRRVRDGPDTGPAVLEEVTAAWHLPADALAALTRPSIVRVAGFDCAVSLTPAELLCGYLPLVRLIHEHPRRPAGRCLVGLAGIPGSGKSTTGVLLERFFSHLNLAPKLRLLSMDGYHLPNGVLDRRSIAQPDGRSVPLRLRKGCPESFDVAALTRDLRLLQQQNTIVNIPQYDRTLHEPVPAAIRVTPADKIILIEGNYLLSSKNPWQAVSALFDVRLFLDAPPAAARAALIQRHQRGGSTPALAEQRVAQNDDLNTQIVLPTRANAHWILHADCGHRLVCVTPPD